MQLAALHDRRSPPLRSSMPLRAASVASSTRRTTSSSPPFEMRLKSCEPATATPSSRWEVSRLVCTSSAPCRFSRRRDRRPRRRLPGTSTNVHLRPCGRGEAVRPTGAGRPRPRVVTLRRTVQRASEPGLGAYKPGILRLVERSAEEVAKRSRLASRKPGGTCSRNLLPGALWVQPFRIDIVLSQPALEKFFSGNDVGEDRCLSGNLKILQYRRLDVLRRISGSPCLPL